MREIEELLALGQYGGVSPTLCQGAGGNASVKRRAEGVMWIKASGYRLSAMREGHGYLQMRLVDETALANSVSGLDGEAANASMSSLMKSLVLNSKSGSSRGLRPSMETWFHVLLDTVVLHTHPVYANAFSCMEGGEEELARLLRERPACVEYHTPGHLLGEAVQREACAYERGYGKPPKQFLLANHGLITTGESAAEVTKSTEEVLEAGRDYFGPLDPREFVGYQPAAEVVRWADELKRLLYRRTGRSPAVRVARYRALDRLGLDENPELPNPLVPDDVICNGRSILVSYESETVADFADRHARALSFSAGIAVRGKGFVFISPSSSMNDAMEEQAVANVAVRNLVRRRGKCRPLAERDMNALLSMESEKHRQAALVEGALACKS